MSDEEAWRPPAAAADGLDVAAAGVVRLWIKRHSAHGGYIVPKFSADRRTLSCSHCYKNLVVSLRPVSIEEREYDGDLRDEVTGRTRIYSEAPPARPEARPDDGSRARVALREDV